MKKRYDYFGSTILVCLMFFVCLSCSTGTADTSQKGQNKIVRAVEVQVVAPETVQEFRRVTGDVMPWETIPVLFKVGGQIAKLDIEEGTSVEKGQVIGVLSSKDYRLTSNLAKAQIDALTPHLKRAEMLMSKDAMSQSQMDTLESQMAVARIRRSQAKSQLGYTVLKAPASGVIIQKIMAVGDMADAQHPVAILAKLKKVKVILPISQRDLPYFKSGTVVTLTAAGLDKTVNGEVTNVGYVADGKTRTFPVTVAVNNDDLSLRAGMIVEAKVNIKSHSGLFLPLDVVSQNLDAMPTVLVVDPSGYRVIKNIVKLGKILGERVEITSGLSPGARVVIKGMVNHGDAVTITNQTASESKSPMQTLPPKQSAVPSGGPK